jgi:hypothetical protein
LGASESKPKPPPKPAWGAPRQPVSASTQPAKALPTPQGAWGGAKLSEQIKQGVSDRQPVRVITVVGPSTRTCEDEVLLEEESKKKEDDLESIKSDDSNDSFEDFRERVYREEAQRKDWDEMEFRLEAKYEIHFPKFFRLFKQDWFFNYYGEEFRERLAHTYDLEQFKHDATCYFDELDYEFGTTGEAKERYHRNPERGWDWAVSGYLLEQHPLARRYRGDSDDDC